MHERDRRNIILRAVGERAVATVADIVDWTGASEATIRRDIAALHLEGRLRRVRGGAEALHPPHVGTLAGRPFEVNEGLNVGVKRLIADRAAAMCEDGDAIIVNGGTTTYQMVHGLAAKRLTVLTNSFPIAETLLRSSRNAVVVPGGTIYREQKIILSPFDEDGTQRFWAKRLFMGAKGVGPLGLMEGDALITRAEQKLIGQAEELVVLVASEKFRQRSPLICCPLSRISTLITDDGIRDEERAMLEAAGVRVETVTAAATTSASAA